MRVSLKRNSWLRLSDLSPFFPADVSVAVLVDGLEGELGARLLPAELLEAHLAVLVAVTLVENHHHRLPEKGELARNYDS